MTLIRLQKITQARFLVLVSLLMMNLFLMSTAIYAQDDTSRVLVPGSVVNGTIDAENITQVYTFEALTGNIFTAIITSVDDLAFAATLTDANGNLLTQAVDSGATGLLNLERITIPADGMYYLIILPASGAGSASGSFQIAPVLLVDPENTTPTDTPVVETEPTTGTIEVVEPTTDTIEVVEPTPEPSQITFTPPTIVSVPNGLEFRLTWTATADMNLQVRDPEGRTLFWDARTTDNGGAFGFDANGLCEQISAAPIETATWQPGFLPTGSYEVLVYYRQSCDSTAPVTFNLQPIVNGNLLEAVSGTLPPPTQNQESVFIITVDIDESATGTVVNSGAYTNINTVPAAAQSFIANPQTIVQGTPLRGAITNEQAFQAYTFVAQENETLNISLSAISGNLDTLLMLLDSSGNLVELSDDIIAGTNTNSAITSFPILRTGEYTILATRYGKEFGGTEGEYEILISSSVVAAVGVTETSTDVGVTDDATALGLILPDGAVEISLIWNTNADIQLLVRDPIGDSVFDDEPFINSGGILEVGGNVNCTVAETARPVSYIYWPSGFLRPGTYEIEVWFQDDCDDPNPVEFSLNIAVNGETIAVERQRPLPNQKYVISFDVGIDGTAVARQGGYIGRGSVAIPYQSELTTATPLLSGTPVVGSINPNNPYDIYTFEGTAGELVTVGMSASSLTLDTYLILVSPNGVDLAINDDAEGLGDARTTDSLISEFELPQSGTYVIIASRYGTIFGGTIGDYTLTMRKF